ncbi:MAG: hypothetical protein NTZ18_03675 [Candidatus Komeilibacteria bacterium]|nr:hypothetical protein [Candidatus Komeilibacteria bacterium]
MTIAKFFTTQFTTKRMSWSGESSALITQSTFDGYLQQAAAELAETLRLNFTRAFTLWCPLGTDVEEGDLISDGEFDYGVKAINKRDYGTNQHLQLIIERHEDYLSV